MWVLALDTTTRDGSVALIRDGVVVVEQAGDAAWSHAERLPADLRAVLDHAGLAPGALDLVAVATGPGAFTGLRIGLAAAQGLALALGRPAAGVPTLAAMAWHALEMTPDAGTAGAWLDASRGEVYAAAYARPDGAADWPLTPLAAATSAAPVEIVRAWATVVPPATPLALSPLAHEPVVRAAGYAPISSASLLAGIVGRLATRLHALGRTGPPAALAPEYVRRPDVEIARDRQRDPSPA